MAHSDGAVFGSYPAPLVLAAYRDGTRPVWVDTRGHHWVEQPDGMVRCVIDGRTAGLSLFDSVNRSFLGPLTLVDRKDTT